MKRLYSSIAAIILLLHTVAAQTVIQPVLNQRPAFNPILMKAPVRTPTHAGGGDTVRIVNDNDMRVPAPANDNCTGGLGAAYTLVPDAPCTAGVTSASSLEGSETFGCISTTPTYSVWYSFVADASNMYVTVSCVANHECSINFGLLVYRYTGICPPSSPLGCTGDIAMVNGNGFIDECYSTVNLTGLTIGATYLIQITQENCVATTRQFCVEVGHPSACATCSSSCGPECYYPSTSTPTVAWLQANCPLYPERPPMNENDSRTMCFTFSAPNTIVNLQLGNTTYCNGYTYAFTWSCYSTSCGSPIATGSYTPTTISGLTVGQNYVLCYTYTTTCSWESSWPYIYAASQLPVELVSFEAKADKSDIDIFWTTSSETNTSQFIVERTTDGENFTEVKRLKAAGNSSSILNYAVQDLSPEPGNNYYRLKEIDIDGKITSGELVSARFTRDFSGLSVMPNPAQNEVGINFASAKNGTIDLSIVDAKGLIVFTKKIIAESEGLNTFPINITSFQPGIYSVRLLDDLESLNTRFVKQ